MDSTSVDCLLTAAKYMNFTKAAEALFMTQSSISKRIASLEKEFGFQIFDRGGRKLALTEAGQKLVDCLTKCDDLLWTTLNDIKKNYQTETETIKIGIINGWDLSRVISTSISNVQKDFPDLKFKVETASDGMFPLMEGLKNGDLDIIFSLSDAFINKNEYVIQRWGATQNILLFSANNPLAQKDHLELADFDGVTLLYQGSFESVLNHLCYTFPFKKDIPHENVDSWDSLLMRLGTKDGYAVCNKLFRDINSSLFCSFDLPYWDEVILVRREERTSPAVEIIMSEICKQGLS